MWSQESQFIERCATEPFTMIPIYLGLFLVAAATFVLEISLTRVFSLAQYYHFAFMAVSLALLGIGASGSGLCLWPRLTKGRWSGRLPWLAVLCGLSMPASYLVANRLPFDSYSIAWDPRQSLYLLMYYLALAMPFAVSGLLVSIPLAAQASQAHRFYGAHLAGSAAGSLGAMLLLPRTGGPGAICTAGMISCLAGAVLALALHPAKPPYRVRWWSAVGVSLVSAIVLAWLVVSAPPFLNVRLSPYKGLTQALRYPGSRVSFSGWNAFSRVDVVESPAVRQLPGISYTYDGAVPPQLGLSIDGDALSPVTLIEDPASQLGFTDFLPAALAYRLRPAARTLILEPRGGLEVWLALCTGASSVLAVEGNPLVLTAARLSMAPRALDVYDDPRVSVLGEAGRSYLQRSQERFDVVHLAFTQPYRPVTSGAYSLTEDYAHTVEAFDAYLDHVAPEGVLVLTQWLQTPPSESLRTLALILAALDRRGVRDLSTSVVAYRGVQSGTFLVKESGFTKADMEFTRAFCTERRFDLVIGPGVSSDELNRFNVLPQPYYADQFAALLAASDRGEFYANYPFAVTPPSDGRPFFQHYFRWRQTLPVLRTLGQTWEPFGGSGVLVLLALLILVMLASVVLILGPLFVARMRAGRESREISTGQDEVAACGEKSLNGRSQERSGGSHTSAADRSMAGASARRVRSRAFVYFALLGLAYLFVEIPLIQRYILYLDQPVQAMSAVLFALLLFSGLGSLRAPRMSYRHTLGVLVLVALAYPLLLEQLTRRTLGLPLGFRYAICVLSLAPLGFLMGMPFAKGMAVLEGQAPRLIPWAWAVNGCSSVLSSIAAPLLALSFGFSVVLGLGAVCYAGATLTFWRQGPHHSRG